MATAYIGLGANLGDREATIRAALERLGSHPQVEVTAISRLIETEPVGGPPEQPPFLNGAAALRTDLEPADLLTLMKEVERELGRDPTGPRWGPRPIDLDLLLYDQRVVRLPGLVVPHPRLRERRFVLEPLAEIAPNARDPETGKTVRELLEALGPAG